MDSWICISCVGVPHSFSPDVVCYLYVLLCLLVIFLVLPLCLYPIPDGLPVYISICLSVCSFCLPAYLSAHPCQFIPVSLPVSKCFPHPASRSHLFFLPLCVPFHLPLIHSLSSCVCVCLRVHIVSLCLVRLCSCVSCPVRSSRIVRVSCSVLCVLRFMINDQWYAHRSCHVKFPTWLGAKTVVVPPRLAVGMSCRFIHPLSLRSCMVVTDYLDIYLPV